MAWKKVNLKRWADEARVDINEIDQKLKLREIILRVRTKRKLTQADVAKIVGVSRSRIAQIEAGVRLQKTSFDVLLRILQGLGYRYSISTKLAA
jgi:transcriptional regulator with XRE-family HTH domain